MEDPNHDADMRIDGEAPGRRALSDYRLEGHGALRDHRHLGSLSAVTQPSNGRNLCLRTRHQQPETHATGRSVRLVGISPVVTSRHRAMSSLRASATIIVLRVGPRASAVRARNHCAKVLSFWKR